MLFRRFTFNTLAPADWLSISFLLTMSIIVLSNFQLFEYWYLFLGINFSIILAIFFIVNIYQNNFSNNSLVRLFRYWYPLFMVLFTFKEIYFIMVILEPVLNDNLLILIDRNIFGCNPTEVLYLIATPILTEFLQIIYILFYIMPVIFGLELYIKKRFNEYRLYAFAVMLGFFLSFIGYLLVPAIGPRFTLHDFQNINSELPGIYITNLLRDIINFGESIYNNTPDPAAIAQRDAFPSGHTIIILVITYLSFRFKTKTFFFYLPYSILMLFSTVYLRYHYVIDLIAGVAIAALVMLITMIFYNSKNEERFKYFRVKNLT
jgi:membrane-associated phospholipid phosphatase